jgi:hypothetical protein
MTYLAEGIGFGESHLYMFEFCNICIRLSYVACLEMSICRPVPVVTLKLFGHQFVRAARSTYVWPASSQTEFPPTTDAADAAYYKYGFHNLIF